MQVILSRLGVAHAAKPGEKTAEDERAKLMASPRQADSVRLRNWAGWRRHRKWAREVSLGSWTAIGRLGAAYRA